MEPTFRLQVAYALRNYAENWEIKELASKVMYKYGKLGKIR